MFSREKYCDMGSNNFEIIKPIIESFLSKYNIINDKREYSFTSLEIIFCCDFLFDRLELSRELVKKDKISEVLSSEEIMRVIFLFVVVLVGVSTDKVKLLDYDIWELEEKQNYASFVYQVMRGVNEINLPVIMEMLDRIKYEAPYKKIRDIVDRLISDIKDDSSKLRKMIQNSSGDSYLGLRDVFWGKILFNFSKIDVDVLTIWDSSDNVREGIDIDGNINSAAIKHDELILCIDDLRIGFLMFDNDETLFSIFLLVDQEKRKYRAVLYDDNIYRHGYSRYKYYQFGLKLPLRDYIDVCLKNINFACDYCTLEELKNVLLLIIKKSEKIKKKKSKKKKRKKQKKQDVVVSRKRVMTEEY